MSENRELDIVAEYFRALRAEIVEAQKMRVQVGLAKIVFLGSLLGFFLKDAKDSTAILICPFVALMFDLMVYGLSFNIRDIGDYIRDHLERCGMECLSTHAFADFKLWQTYRTERQEIGYRDWGRGLYRTGSYGLSILVAIVSVFQVFHSPTTKAGPLLPIWWLILMISILALGWGSLIWREFLQKANRPLSVATDPKAD